MPLHLKRDGRGEQGSGGERREEVLRAGHGMGMESRLEDWLQRKWSCSGSLSASLPVLLAPGPLVEGLSFLPPSPKSQRFLREGMIPSKAR